MNVRRPHKRWQPSAKGTSPRVRGHGRGSAKKALTINRASWFCFRVVGALSAQRQLTAAADEEAPRLAVLLLDECECGLGPDCLLAAPGFPAPYSEYASRLRRPGPTNRSVRVFAVTGDGPACARNKSRNASGQTQTQ